MSLSNYLRLAGGGPDLSFRESSESYQDHKVKVRLPSDYVQNISSLSGPVVSYNMNDINHNQ